MANKNPYWFWFQEDDEIEFPVGKGWYGIILKAFGELLKLENKNFRIFQIKEKYGSLRIYFSSSTEQAEKIADIAERKSLFTCEECGSSKGTLISQNYWLMTLCDVCAKKLKEEKYK